ncbi:MAG: hypothetical protein GDA36_05775 [Rhodobacteraceae bacterium]|nr:hypothetical protein [Paracoccaceae bacterium]
MIGAVALATGDIRQMQIAELSSCFRVRVIIVSDTFVKTASGFEDYQGDYPEALIRWQP